MRVKMKVKGGDKTYEYDTKMIVVNTDTRSKLKLQAVKEKMTMMEFVEKLVTDYENTSD